MVDHDVDGSATAAGDGKVATQRKGLNVKVTDCSFHLSCVCSRACTTLCSYLRLKKT